MQPFHLTYDSPDFVFAGNKSRRANLFIPRYKQRQYQHVTLHPLREKSGKHQVLRVWQCVTSKFKWVTQELEPSLIPSLEKFMTLLFQKATVFLFVLPSWAQSTEATHTYLPAAEPLPPATSCYVFVPSLCWDNAVPPCITHMPPQHNPSHTSMLLKHLPYSDLCFCRDHLPRPLLPFLSHERCMFHVFAPNAFHSLCLCYRLAAVESHLWPAHNLCS